MPRDGKTAQKSSAGKRGEVRARKGQEMRASFFCPFCYYVGGWKRAMNLSIDYNLPSSTAVQEERDRRGDGSCWSCTKEKGRKNAPICTRFFHLKISPIGCTSALPEPAVVGFARLTKSITICLSWQKACPDRINAWMVVAQS